MRESMTFVGRKKKSNDYSKRVMVGRSATHSEQYIFSLNEFFSKNVPRLSKPQNNSNFFPKIFLWV